MVRGKTKENCPDMFERNWKQWPAILTNSNQVCDFIDVEIAAEQIAYVTANSLNGVFNICSGVPISVRQFAEKIAKECGRSDLLRFETGSKYKAEPRRIV